MRLQVNKLGKVAVTVEQDYWSETKSYDRLVIVESETLGITFISRKEVPAGTTLTDREFWIPLGVTKGATDVTELYQKVSKLEIDIKTLNDLQISTVNALNNLTNKVTSIEQGNTTEGIDSLNEIKAFLTDMLDTDRLSDKLENVDGDITPTYDESSGKLTLS